MNISVVVPVYESASTLAALIDSLEPVLQGAADRFEIILVNDGSKDNSWRVVSELVRAKSHVKGICLMRNYGQHNALVCGVRAAKYEVTVTVDDDLQNPAEEIPKLLEKLNEGFDVVYGVPEKQTHGFLRNVSSVVTKLILQQAIGSDIARSVYSFRAFRTSIRDAFTDYRSPYVFLDVLLAWGADSFAAVKVRQNPRNQGRSNYTFKKLVMQAVNMLTGFSTLPLRLASINGFVFILFGLGALTHVFAMYLKYHGPVPGFTFLAGLIIIFSGAQLLALGIIGEYLARMYSRSMDLPTYVVRCTMEPSVGDA